MREPPARRMFGLSAIMLAGLLVGGCNSTASLPSSMTHDAQAKPAPASPGTEIACGAQHVPSTALAHDQWDAPAPLNNPIQKTTFQDQPGPKLEFPPVPEVMVKEPTREVVVQPPLMKPGKHHGPPMPMALPNAPSESNPIALPTYMIRPPDVLLIDSQKGLLTQPIRGQHLVRVDGTVGLGIYGPASVTGKTIQQAREEIARVIHSKLDPKAVKFDDVLEGLSVDVLAYNSSVYYIIFDGAGLGEQVYRFPVTGNETVLDAIANVNGLPLVASPKRIWVSRRNVAPGHDSLLPVDWKGITQMGAMNTNWQIMPGDRVYVQADPMRRFNNNLGKMLEPIERIMGATLLGAQTVNSIKGNPTGIR